MNRRLRVLKALKGEPVDRVPKGELLIDQEFIAEYLAWCGARETGAVSFQDQVHFLEKLEMDLISLLLPFALAGAGMDRPEKLALAAVDTSAISKWAEHTDFFVFAIVGGGFQPATTYYDFMKILQLTVNDPELAGRIFARFAEINTEIALQAIADGADGVIIGDDIAYNRATHLAPAALRVLLFPHLQQMVVRIKEQGVPVFFHADGNLNQVLADIVSLGFDGIHSLQPSAGMDIGEIKRQYGDRFCLMGNMDLDRLIPFGSPAEIEQEVQATMAAAKGGSGYIFGTCGALSKGLPAEKVRALYRAAAKWGQY